MKSITKKISFLLIFSIVFFLSSCLDSGQTITGNDEPAYISEGSTGTLYARTQRGYLITFSGIEKLTPGDIVILSYQIPKKNEQVTVETDIKGSKIVADVAELTKEPITLDEAPLYLIDAPVDASNEMFKSLSDPLYAQNEYFGDRWIFFYTLNIKKGESANISFYKATDNDAKNENTDVLIDIILEKTGTPDEGATKKEESDYIVVDMSELRLIMDDKTDLEGNISVKFRYYSLDKEKQLVIPYNSFGDGYLMYIGNN